MLVQALPEDSLPQLEAWLREKKGAAVTLATPKRGEKHELVRLAAKNAADALEKRNARAAIRQERTVGACEGLAKALGLPKAPRRIEGYDISNTQGVLSVASMVVFIDGVAAKKEYRHFRIKTVVGANDFASMNEVLGRRFSHGLEEKKERKPRGSRPLEESFRTCRIWYSLTVAPSSCALPGKPCRPWAQRYPCLAWRKAGGDLSSRPGRNHLPGSPYAGAASGAAHSR